MLTAGYSLWTASVTVLALLILVYMTIRVGMARGRTGIEAPAMTGAPELERAIRVHSNTLESMPLFLGSLWLATLYFSPAFPAVEWLPPALGAVSCVGRLIYMRGYMIAADKRSMGYMVSTLPTLVNLILAIVGIVCGFMAASF